MKLSKKVRLTAGSLAVGAAILTSATAASAAPQSIMQPRHPSCVVSTTGTPGIKSFTLHVDKNPCGRKVRAYIDPTVTGRTYGPTITGTCTSKAETGLLNDIKHYGHEVYVGGQWVEYQDG